MFNLSLLQIFNNNESKQAQARTMTMEEVIQERRRKRSFEVSLAVLYDLAAIESEPLSCQFGPRASSCQLESVSHAFEKRKKRFNCIEVQCLFFLLVF